MSTLPSPPPSGPVCGRRFRQISRCAKARQNSSNGLCSFRSVNDDKWWLNTDRVSLYAAADSESEYNSGRFALIISEGLKFRRGTEVLFIRQNMTIYMLSSSEWAKYSKPTLIGHYFSAQIIKLMISNVVYLCPKVILALLTLILAMLNLTQPTAQ